MSSRKILIAVIVVLFVVIIVGLYFLFFGVKAVSTTDSGQTGQIGTLPNAGTQTNPGTSASNSSSSALATNFGVVANEPILDYFVNAANTVTAVEPNGEIIQVTNGQMTTISTSTTQNILGASFSYDGEKVLVNFGASIDPQTSVFDLTKQTWTPLPEGLQSPTWSPIDYRIAYYTSGAQGTESFATLDMSKAKLTPLALLSLHAQDLAIAWPAKNQIVIYTKPSAYVAGSAWAYNPQTATLAPIAFEVPGLTMLFSSANGLEFSAGGDGIGGSLSLTDASGNILQQLKFATLPSKCSFSSTATSSTASTTPYLYCGVPRDQDTFSISHLPDDYDQMALFTSDDIYRIDLQSGAIDTIFNDQSQNLDVSDMKFFNGTLFFINRYDQKLYGIGLMTI